MKTLTIAKRTFSNFDQLQFANFSADLNPMHMNPIAARRTQAGRPVVHGVHVFLWAIDTLLKNKYDLRALQKIRVRFNKFVFLDTEIALVVTKVSDNSINVEIHDNSLILASIKCKIGRKTEFSEKPDCDLQNKQLPHIQTPSSAPDLELSSMAGMEGRISNTGASSDIDRLQFQSMEAQWGREFVISVAQLSTLVGMHCPGLHSIFSGFSLILEASAVAESLAYKVTDTDERFNLVNMSVLGSGFTGTVDAFVRQKPLALPDMTTLKALVPKACFESMNALIIGGSRGLGEATARLIAAGDGKVTVTYAHGESDARDLQNVLNSDGDCCSILKFDAFKSVRQQLEALSDGITHLFYFATPQIFRQNINVLDQNVLEEFMQVYVHAFNDTCLHLMDSGLPTRLTAFYPSTVAIDNRPKGLTEYTMAKIAGEILCKDLEDPRKLKIVVARLPRVNTDQTATVTPVDSEDAISLMYRYLLELNDSSMSFAA